MRYSRKQNVLIRRRHCKLHFFGSPCNLYIVKCIYIINKLKSPALPVKKKTFKKNFFKKFKKLYF